MIDIITEWHPEKVYEAAMKELESNGQIVGRFVEEEARRRLDAISKPDDKRSVAYRRFLSQWVLTNKVSRDGKGVLIEVGMRRGPGKGGDTRGFYIEIGSYKIPATSYLRRSVLENRSKIMKLLSGK